MLTKKDPNAFDIIPPIKVMDEKDVPQAVLDLAKKEGYKYCTFNDKKYQGCDMYELHYTTRLQYIGGYPAIALYKDGKARLAKCDETIKIVKYFSSHSTD